MEEKNRDAGRRESICTTRDLIIQYALIFFQYEFRDFFFSCVRY